MLLVMIFALCCLIISVMQVLDILTASGELTNLIRNVDTIFHSRQAGTGKSMANTISRYIPSIREQLQVFIAMQELEPTTHFFLKSIICVIQVVLLLGEVKNYLNIYVILELISLYLCF